jgi:FMN-dependent NADH-azoreductase
VTSPRKEKSASTAIVNAFLSEYRAHIGDVTVDTLDIWQEKLPVFDAEAIDAKYKGVSGESMTPGTGPTSNSTAAGFRFIVAGEIIHLLRANCISLEGRMIM